MVTGLVAGVVLISLFVAFPVQTQYDRNLKLSLIGSDCAGVDCTYANIENCRIDSRSVMQSNDHFIWIVNVRNQDAHSCLIAFEYTNIVSANSQFKDFTRYECHITSDMLANTLGDVNHDFIQDLVTVGDNRCSAWSPSIANSD